MNVKKKSRSRVSNIEGLRKIEPRTITDPPKFLELMHTSVTPNISVVLVILYKKSYDWMKIFRRVLIWVKEQP